MQGRVAKLESTLTDLSGFCDNAYVFRLGIVRVHPAQVGQPEPSVPFHLRNHAAQRIRMGFQQQSVVLLSRTAQEYQYAALPGQSGVKTKFGKFIPDPRRSVLGIAGGRIYIQECFRFPDQEIGVLSQVFHIRNPLFAV